MKKLRKGNFLSYNWLYINEKNGKSDTNRVIPHRLKKCNWYRSTFVFSTSICVSVVSNVALNVEDFNEVCHVIIR